MSKDEAQRKISCLDLKAQHQELKEEIFQAFERVYDSTAFSGGPFVEEFEVAFAAYLGTAWAIGVSNGTVALHLAMSALEIGPGDEVIIPANTFIATAWGVSHAGATPVFVDCEPDTWEIDAVKAAAAVTGRTRAIIGVHLYGQPFDVEALKAVCCERRIALVEDAAQAHGARYKDTRVGSFGEMACFSFYPGKNLGACGEAGAVATSSESLAMRLRSLRNHGSSVRYYHDEIGYNYRMGGLEGASLRVKLRYLDGWNERRRAIAAAYRREIQNPKIRMQHSPSWADPVHHLFVVTTEERNDFVDFLREQGIFPAFHYPVPCHLQKAYSHLGYQPGDLPHAEYLAAHCVSLPMYPELTEAEVHEVIRAVNAY